MSTVPTPRRASRSPVATALGLEQAGSTPAATPDGPALPPPLVRASNQEREETVTRLHHALGEGRLDLAETDVRVAAAYAATYRSELPPLLADLPGAQGSQSPAPAWSAIWTSVVWRTRTALLGPAGSSSTPDARQCRLAAVLAVLAAVWMMGCAFLGAALVGS